MYVVRHKYCYLCRRSNFRIFRVHPFHAFPFPPVGRAEGYDASKYCGTPQHLRVAERGILLRREQHMQAPHIHGPNLNPNLVDSDMECQPYQHSTQRALLPLASCAPISKLNVSSFCPIFFVHISSHVPHKKCDALFLKPRSPICISFHDAEGVDIPSWSCECFNEESFSQVRRARGCCRLLY